MNEMSDLVNTVGVSVRALREIANVLEEAATWGGVARPYVDMADDLPVNHRPDHPYLVARGWQWWPERDAVTGITIHHTLSHSPLATAQYCTRSTRDGGKGYPSIQYHFWVSAGDGCECYRCAPVEWAMWHDHTGAHPTTISVGMAGALHVAAPPAEQIAAAARLVAWLMAEYRVGLGEIRGHKDRYSGTVCPGWDHAGWRAAFYGALEEELDGV